MKKFLAIFMAACLCFTLAACGSGGNAGGNGEQQKVPLGEHKHVYTTKSSCDLCGEAWNATETDAFTFTPVTIDGVAGYDVTFGEHVITTYPLLPDGRYDHEHPITEIFGKPYEGKELVLPCVHDGKPVISVGRGFPAYSETLKKITIPDSIFSFGNADVIVGTYSSVGAFSSCIALEEIVLPYEPNLGSVDFDTEAAPFSYGSIVPVSDEYRSPISQSHDADGGLYIGEYLIDVSDNVNSFTIKEGTKGIAYSALYGPKLEEIHIPDSVVEIGYDAIGGSSTLKKVTFGENSRLKKLDYGAFAGCLSLTEIELPGGLEIIGDSAFEGCRSLSEISIPDSVKRVGIRAFYLTPYETENYRPFTGECIFEENEFYNGNCLMRVNPDFEGHYTVREGTTAIAGNAFSGCTKITSVTLPEDFTVIEGGIFSGCSSLKSIEIPKGVTYIGAYAFSNSGLESISVPESVTKIAQQTFYQCMDLKEITLPKSLKHIGPMAFYNCASLNSIEFPDGVTEIGKQAFYTCVLLKNVVLPNGVTTIGEGAFAACNSLEKITIPKSVTSLGYYSLHCGALKEIEFGGTVEEWKHLAFVKDSMTDYVISLEDLIITCSDGKLDQEGNVIEN